MLLQQQKSVHTNLNYKIISRWMHKTLNDWRMVLKENGADVLIYEEYIDFTTNKEYFEKFIYVLGQYCPNLRHVRLLFSGDSNDIPEAGIVECVLRLSNVQCLSLFDVPSTSFCELKNNDNQLTTLKLAGLDKKISINCLVDILGSMQKLHSLVYHYKEHGDQFVAALTNLTELKSLTLLYVPRNELIQLKNCNQLKILHLYNIYEKISTDDFLNIFKSKCNLHSLSICIVEESFHLAGELYKLDAYCPQLTNLTLNCNLDNYGDFVNLKHLKFDMDYNLSPIEMEQLLRLLYPKYADRLQILDISTCPQHTQTIEITKLKSLKAFLCWSWPSNMYKCLSELADLQFFAMEDNSNDNDALMNMIETCSKLRYLRLPRNTKRVDELILALPDILHRRNLQPEIPFVLSLAGTAAVPQLIEKLKAHPHGNLLQLDWNGKVFASKIKDLIATDEETADQTIYQNPCKMAGDRLGPEDHWLSNMNYKIALKSCSNKFNLEYDEMIVNRCRDMTIQNADYELTNMQFAFNFKYHALDEYNE